MSLIFGLASLVQAQSQESVGTLVPTWRVFENDILVNSLAVDSAGAIFASGGSRIQEVPYGPLGPSRGLMTFRYNPEAARIWSDRYGTDDDEATASALDSGRGRLYVTGRSKSFDGSTDIVTIAYNKEGQRLWLERFGTPTNDDDVPVSLKVDSDGGVYISGYSTNSSSSAFLALKYDAEGTLIWENRFSGPVAGAVMPTALEVGADGSVYVTGSAPGTTSTNLDYVIIKYSSSGSRLWERFYDGPGHGEDRPAAIALDRAGNVLVSGQSAGTSATGIDYATLKISPSGEILWVARYDHEELHGSDGATDILSDDQGNVYVTGGAEVVLTNRYGWQSTTIKYDPFGRILWRTALPDEFIGIFSRMVLDPSGDLYVVSENATSNNWFLSGGTLLAKYNSAGVLLEQFKNVSHSPRVLTLGDDGNVYAAGHTSSGQMSFRGIVAGWNMKVVTHLTLRATALQNGRLSLAVSGDSGHWYELQSSNDLKTWVPVETKQAVSSNIEFSVLASPESSRRFYRVKETNQL